MSKKGVFFFLIFIFIAVVLTIGLVLLTPPEEHVAEEIGVWEDFNQDHMFMVQVMPDRIDISSDSNGMKQYHKRGHWANHAFYCISPNDSTAEVEVAREKSDESLLLEMKYFDPTDATVRTCTKTMRGMDEICPYPVYTDNQTVSYPPPKGLIREGMLKADLDMLPWHSYQVEMRGGDHYGGPSTYCYHSDNSNIPELRVTVLDGLVANVTGGNEDQPGPSWPDNAPPGISTTPGPRSRPTPKTWELLFDLFFKK